ncbi:MAG: tetratricopeptide repeat protein [Candidatus Micrarchaeia archaeon]
MASKKSKTGHIERYNAGVVFYNKKDYDKAITEFRAALSGDSKNPKYKMALASCYNNRGVAKYDAKKYEQAVNDFRMAKDFEPTNNQYLQNLKLAQDSAKKSAIDKLCKNAYELYNNKKYGESIKNLLAALKMDQDDKELNQALAVAYNGRGVMYYSQTRFDLAEKDFAMAKGVWPHEPQYDKNLELAQKAAKTKVKKKK